MTRTTLADAYGRAATDYIQRGWPVFLLGRTKRPVANCRHCPTGRTDGHDPTTCGHLTCHGVYAATLDPDRFQAIREAIPGGLLAIRTGQISRLVIVDIDPRHGGAPDLALMPPTATVRSGGGGWHLYYQHPGIRTRAKLADRPGVDIKGDGNYVLAPPAIHPDTHRPYRWVGGRAVEEVAPALRAALAAPAVDPAPPVVPRPGNPAAGGAATSSLPVRDPAALLAATLRAVEQAPQGKRRKTLYGAARGAARLVAAGHLTTADAVAQLTDTGHAAQQTPRDIHNAIVGGFRDEGVPL